MPRWDAVLRQTWEADAYELQLIRAQGAFADPVIAHRPSAWPEESDQPVTGRADQDSACGADRRCVPKVLDGGEGS